MEIVLNEDWKEALSDELEKDYMRNLFHFLENEALSHRISPPEPVIFEAFNQTPFSDVKVVVLGQDPYHQLGQSHGLAFSVQAGTRVPPSLRNIFKAIENDFSEFKAPDHGNLTYWAKQGVLLLNTTLTVRESQAGSHQKKGWERFTDRIIQLLSNERSGLVFMLWGKPAQQKEVLIDSTRHCILKSVHPSPLSAFRGFLTAGHFLQANRYLLSLGKKPIDWQIPNIPSEQ
jgi:uracil-DNA glycosylase